MEYAHPGPSICQQARERGLRQKDLAQQLGVSDPFISDLCKGKRDVSPNIAVKLERIGIGKAIAWLQMQGDYDTAQKIAALP